MSKHILFVDDERSVRETLSVFFQRKGFSVSLASNAKDAMQSAKAAQFDLVILDIDLGSDNGLELLEWFKKNYPAIPVILFTSLGYDPVLLKETMARGASAFMSKDESLDDLMKEVQRVCA